MWRGFPQQVLRRWRELAGFAVLFRLLESLLFAPVAALMGKWLLGRTVLDSTALVGFLLSPRGLLALAFGAVTALTIRLVEHAGMSAICFGAADDRRVPSREALRLVWRRLRVLVGVSVRFVGVGLITVLPLVAVAGGIASRLLSRHDVNYYLKLRPPEFLIAATVIGGVGLMTAAMFLWLIVRWRWVAQVVMFEQKSGREAFARSAVLTRGIRGRLTGAMLGVAIVVLALGIIAAVAGDACTSILLAVTGEGGSVLAVSFGVLLVVRTIIGAVFTFLGSCVDAGVFTLLYRRRGEMTGEAGVLAIADAAQPAAAPRWLPAMLLAGLLGLGTSGVWFALGAISDDRLISVHAHRGVSGAAPENTLAAVRAAIVAGADYVETDVQLSRDDVLVVVHDSDFSRLGGVAKKVWELTYDEIRAIPIGRDAAPEFRHEITPTLEALLAEAKGRIRVNIELKFYGDHQPGLARKVIEAVRTRGMLDQVVIQCLEYEPLLEVRRLAPGIPIGYLLSFNARKPTRLEVDFLSVEQGRIDRALIVNAHRNGQEVYAWTVNQARDMERLCDLGVDGVITDDSALARRTIDAYRSRSKAERAGRRVRAWLSE